MRDKQKRKRKPRARLFHLAVTLLCLLLVILTFYFLANIRVRDDRYTYDANSILHTLDRGDYYGALENVLSNRAQGITETTDPAYLLPYAAADYYQAALYLSAYEAAGDTAQTERWQKAKDAAYEKMGELQFLAEDMDAVLGIEN